MIVAGAPLQSIQESAPTPAIAAARWRKQRLEWDGPHFYAVLKQISDGHNDPRTIAAEAIRGYIPLPPEDGK